jgi:outer membrane lipoprotein-sorting protein
MNNLKVIPVIMLVLLLCLSCSVQKKPTTAQVVDELTRKAQQVESYAVDTKTVTNMKGNSITITGKTVWKKPDMMHIITNMMNGSKQEIYHTSGVVWTYNPMMKMATKMDISKVKDMPGDQSFGKTKGPASLLENFPKEAMSTPEKKTVDGNEVYVFQMSPEQGAPSTQQNVPMPPHPMEIMIFADTGLPYKLSMRDKDGSLLMEQTYSNYQVNNPIPDSEFQFTPPEGVQIMDMSEASMNMMNRMKGQGEKSQINPHE